jgi:hypothetical protein
MKIRLPQLLATFICITLSAMSSYGQCDTTAYYANRYMTEDFIPDGQSYRALIYDDQVAEFHTTFYSGAKYRIVSFSGLDKEQLIFSLYDEQDNLLYTNEEFKNSAYWDFEFDATMPVRIEARLDLLKQTSGCAVLLIGFER